MGCFKRKKKSICKSNSCSNKSNSNSSNNNSSNSSNNNSNSNSNNSNDSNANGNGSNGIMFAIGLSIVLITFALSIGMLGYHYFAELPLIDALLNSSMILSGMGPVNVMPNSSAKLFASFYALFSGLAFISLIAIILSVFLHEFAAFLGANVAQEGSTRRRRNRRF